MGTNTLTCGAVNASGVLTFPATMSLASDITSARVVLWGGAGGMDLV